MRFFIERRNAIWLCCAFASVLAAAPALAQGTPQAGDASAPPPPPDVKRMAPLPPLPPPPSQAEKDAQRTVPGAYRLTYTLTEMDGEKHVGSQRYKIVLDADAPPARVDLQTTVTVLYGSSNDIPFRTNVGLRFFARLRKFANGVELNTDIHQTAFANGTKVTAASTGVPPITRVADLSSTVLLTENKPVAIGELDVPGSTHRLQIQVELTRVR
jgi:hypothetical protein